jgi:hypothetical protein
VAAYFDRRKIGYLSDRTREVWNALPQSSAHRAIVVGEILDEAGELIGLDVEVFIESDRPERKVPHSAGPLILNRRRVGLRSGIGLAVLLVALAAMATEDSIGPTFNNVYHMEQRQAALAGDLIEQRPFTSEPANFMRLDLLDQTARYLFMPDSDTVEIGYAKEQSRLTETPDASASEDSEELQRKALQAAAHRQAANNLRLERAANLVQQAETHKNLLLAQQLREAEALAARQKEQFAELARKAQESMSLMQADKRKLQTEIVQLNWQLAEVRRAQQVAEEEALRLRALQALTDREIVQHRQRMVAWKSAAQTAALLKASKKKTASAAKAATPSAPAQPEPTVKVRKKANFSRYVQKDRDAEEADGTVVKYRKPGSFGFEF